MVDKWISVKERLPEDFDHYLIFDGRIVREASFYNGFWFDPVEEYEFYGNVIYWMPLPEPPKEES